MNALSPRDAVKLDKEIRSTVAAVWDNLTRLGDLVHQAINGQAHIALGYKTAQAYLKDVLAGQPKLGSQKDRERRDQVIALLRGQGMSQREIADILGISHMTVNRSGGTNVPPAQPDIIVGKDGKSYPAQRRPALTPADDDVIDAEVVDDEPGIALPEGVTPPDFEKAEERIKAQKKANHTGRFIEVGNHLGYINSRLRQVAEAVEGVTFTDDESEILIDDLGKVRARISLIELTLGGGSNIDWDNEFQKLTSENN
jgi:hypothetical protein